MTHFEQQKAADRAHHQERVEWLEGDSPTWSDGTPVSKHDQKSMLDSSRQCLADESGMLGYNSADPSYYTNGSAAFKCICAFPQPTGNGTCFQCGCKC